MVTARLQVQTSFNAWREIFATRPHRCSRAAGRKHGGERPQRSETIARSEQAGEARRSVEPGRPR